ncbi:Mitogen-activated protein kinase kinase kinase [Parasponia andersonii]|uniref:Mitogen-activated protein kinase kinase kinase n=1 Tax=Parasponia andersonii TaxID=3476 RepID=A0A2P5C9J4_PARAD|nr:Mitogen-activated protein kinase kinase kinase [Parasponia andersonii]
MSQVWRWVLVFFTVCILGWRPSSINAATDPQDAAALRVMFTSMNSPGQLSGWNANGDDPCGQNWRGVTCSGQRVTEIKLPNLGLSGSIGYQLTSLTSVTNLDLGNNNLNGGIPYALPPNLTRLNLGGNQFNGGIPYSISLMTSLQYLNISHNQIQNQLDDMFGKLSSLSTLDLSFNNIPGNLPESFSSLSSVTTMDLQNNQLTGPIDVLANLPLENLNVENNRFTGWIPEQLKNINLKRNVDNLTKQRHDRKDGNSWSSGPAPPPPPGTPPANRNNRNHKSGNGNSSSNNGGEGGKSSGIGAGGIAGIVISIFVVGGIIAFFVIKRRSRRSSPDIEKVDKEPFTPLASNEVQEMKSIQTSFALNTKTFDAPASINLRPPPIERHKSFDDDDFSKKPVVKTKSVAAPINVTSYSVADLQMATGSFSVENLLGDGSFGRVYRAQFDDGKVLAVKKIDPAVLLGQSSEEDFTKIVLDISHLHHPNVTELMGYCAEHGQHLLVYEFHKNGSLHDFLHLSDEYSKPLIWNTRVKLALGTARALEYLHEVCSPSIVHKNVKSSNILLDAELNPHLSDCGLAHSMRNGNQYLNSHSDFGFNAPEILMAGQYSLKSDVYSFGVIMLELLTGRKPFDSSRPRDEQSLVRWASPQLHDIDALSKMVDPALEGLYPIKSLSRFADVIALCIQAEPEFRPPMSEVVEALVRLVQRANMSKRTISNDQGPSKRGDNPDTPDSLS